MVNTFGTIEEFAPYRLIADGVIHRIAWGRQDEPAEEGKAPSLCTYTLEHYTYKPTMAVVLTDIQKSGRQASMEEVKAICEGLEAGNPLEYMKQALEAYVDIYDQSGAVNSFLLDGESVWLDKSTRVGLMNSTTIAKAAGHDTTTVWFSGRSIELTCQEAIGMLSQLEMYALECFNRTAAHKAAIQQLETVEAALSYDYKAGYPEKLSFETKQ